jgi:hypothetical protein
MRKSFIPKKSPYFIAELYSFSKDLKNFAQLYQKLTNVHMVKLE